MNNLVSGSIGAVIGFIGGVIATRKIFMNYYKDFADKQIDEAVNSIKVYNDSSIAYGVDNSHVVEITIEEDKKEKPAKPIDYSSISKETKTSNDKVFTIGCEEKSS